MPGLCIVITGSRRIGAEAFDTLAKLAEHFCRKNYTVISGGEKQGVDLAAETGASRMRDGEHLILYLSPQFHRFNQYPPQAQRYFIPVGPGAHLTPSWQLAWDQALPEQRGKYWELFWRNAYIAMAADVIFEWRIDEHSRSTEHLLRCARMRGKPIVNCREAWDSRTWSSDEEFLQLADMLIEELGKSR